MVKILDCTTRDGGHQTNWTFSQDYVFNLMDKLNMLGVAYYEIGYRNHCDNVGKGEFYNCSPVFLKLFYERKGNLEIGVMTDVSRCNTYDFPGKENDLIDFVRVACHPQEIPSALEIAETLYNKGYKIFVQLMDVSNVDENGYMALCSWNKKNILESIYLADSYGNLSVDDVENLMKKYKTLGFERISFHGHNGKIVLNNTIKAIDCGAYSVDTTQNGIGRFGGNLDIDEFFGASSL